MKISAFLFTLLFCCTVNAQFIDGGLEGLRLITKSSDDLNRVQGSPYLNENFQYGTVEIKDKQPMKAFLRYDVQTDQIEIKTDPESNDIYVLGNRPNVTYVMGNKTIIADRIPSENGILSGLFVEHYGGEKYRLLEKHRVDVSEAVKASSSYDSDKPAQMKVNSDFYVVVKGEAPKLVRIKHKDVKKLFSSKTAKDYLSDHKIKEVEDLVAFLQFLDQKS